MKVNTESIKSILEKPKALIFDIDGVVADSSARIVEHMNPEMFEVDVHDYRKGFVRFNSAELHGDIPLEAGIQLVNSLFKAYEVGTTFALTSRSDLSFDNTLKWLNEHMPFKVLPYELIMKPEFEEHSDGRMLMPGGIHDFCSMQYKRDAALKILEEYDVVAAVDDQLRICEMYQSLGIPAIHLMLPGVDCVTPAGGDDVHAIRNKSDLQ